MKKYIQLLLIIFILSSNLVSQNCFFPLQDQSGYRQLLDENLIETEAGVIKDSLPSRFRDDFGVFDFGYYHLNEFMPEAYNEIWNQEIKNAKIQKNFYLFIGRIYSNNPDLNRIKVEIVFPQTGDFDCVTNEQIQFLEHQITISGNKNIDNSVSNIYSVTLQQLKDFILDKKICCNTSNRFSCSNCIEDESFVSYLNSLGYKETATTFTEALSYIDSLNGVKEFAKIKFNLDGISYDVNQTIKNLVQDYKEFSGNVTAEIHLYNNSNCDIVFKLIEENEELNCSGSSFSKLKLSVSNPFLEIKYL